MKETKVFVYGTLKKGDKRRGLANWTSGVRFIGTAVTSDPSYSLYDLGAFPAAVINGNSHILGEVWAVDDQTMQELDDIEGYPAFYKRTQVNTTQGRAWMYHIPDIKNYNATRVEPDTDRIASWRN